MAANWAAAILTPLGYLFSSSSARTVSPALVVVAAISWMMVSKLRRFAAPVESNEGKKAMFDFVPFAGAGRQMADGDGDAQGICQRLQFDFPQPDAMSVAAPAISRDQQACGFG